jgi:hypothetical protein
VASPARPAFLDALETKDVKLKGVVGPSVYAFGDVRPMNRIRAYTSAGLSPFAGRGNPTEFLLLGHIHVDADGKVDRIEGFNGQEGERWAKEARERLAKTDALASNATLIPTTPLKQCPYTGFR